MTHAYQSEVYLWDFSDKDSDKNNLFLWVQDAEKMWLRSCWEPYF